MDKSRNEKRMMEQTQRQTKFETDFKDTRQHEVIETF